MFLHVIEKIIDCFFALIPRKKPSQAVLNNLRIIAHRGAHHNAQGVFENTIAAFDLAKKAGCWGIEFDVQATKDNVLMVNHDPTLARLWGHKYRIADLTFTELRALVPDIPSLQEVIARYSSMHLFIELKKPFDNEAVLAKELEHLTPIQDYHLLALEPALFKNLSLFPKRALLLVPLHNNVKQFCSLSLEQHYGGVMGNYLLLTKPRITELLRAQQLCGVGFINSKNSLYRELNRGITWIFTNQAEKLKNYL